MTLAELQKALRAADARAVLVPPRVLENILQEARTLRVSGWSTPHRKCFVVDRQTLFRHVEQAYLDLEPDQLLPETVILLMRPPAEELSELESKRVLLKYWRRLFHASVHLALDADPKHAADKFPPDRVRQRVAEIGRPEFDEIRAVLAQDDYLDPDADDRATYIEFAAVFLETLYFADALLPGLFPALHDMDAIARMLAKDVDARELFGRTRLKGAPDPEMAFDTGAEESEFHEQYWNLVRAAQKANLANDDIGAAILRTRAWRIAPAALGQRTRQEAMADINRLMGRLANALRLSSADVVDWGRDLPLLLDKADQGERPAEARLLFDLQRICTDSERSIYALDIVEFLLSAGKRPIKRPLPSLRQVRITRNLRSATRHLRLVRLHETDRQHFSVLIQAALEKMEKTVREQFGQVLTAALEDVGLEPRNPPERVALQKMVAEWLDRILSHGYLTFSDLRDTISRNQLKMPDLRDRDFVRGDPLLRLDRRLSSLLDGVYRPGDIYMRVLEHFTSMNFGTVLGRAITLWITIPFGGAALLLQVLGLLWHLIFKTDGNTLVGHIHRILVGPSKVPSPADQPTDLSMHLILLGALGMALMALIHIEPLRRRCRRALRGAGRALRRVAIDLPLHIIRLSALQELIHSWQVQLLWLYVFKPALICTLIWVVLPPGLQRVQPMIAIFLGVTVLINSRLGEAATEGMKLGITSLADLIRAGLIPGLFRLVMRVSKQIIDRVELVLFSVDDWLRFRKGDSRLSLILSTVLGTIWFPVSYLARFFIVVMIEPGFNPAKAPVSYLAAKVLVPFWPVLTGGAQSLLRPFMWEWLAVALSVSTVWLLPDAFGFLFWETQENWNLFRANRRKTLVPVAIGPSGETVKALLQPGFHSGTIPRLYARLRAAERRASGTRNWADARACRQELSEISCCIERFVSRELPAMLEQTAVWQGHPITVTRVELTVRRIIVVLSHAHFTARPVQIEFEFRYNALIAGITQTGWLDQLDTVQLHAFAAALASLYKLSGVDIVREQVRNNLPADATRWDVGPEGLLIWQDAQSPPMIYSLRDMGRPGFFRWLRSRNMVDPRRLVFARQPLIWSQWLANWDDRASGNGRRAMPDWHLALLRLESPAANPMQTARALREPDPSDSPTLVVQRFTPGAA